MMPFVVSLQQTFKKALSKRNYLSFYVDLQFLFLVRKLPEANDKTAIDFKKFDRKKSIFFDFLQIVPDAI